MIVDDEEKINNLKLLTKEHDEAIKRMLNMAHTMRKPPATTSSRVSENLVNQEYPTATFFHIVFLSHCTSFGYAFYMFFRPIAYVFCLYKLYGMIIQG